MQANHEGCPLCAKLWEALDLFLAYAPNDQERLHVFASAMSWSTAKGLEQGIDVKAVVQCFVNCLNEHGARVSIDLVSLRDIQ